MTPENNKDILPFWGASFLLLLLPRFGKLITILTRKVIDSSCHVREKGGRRLGWGWRRKKEGGGERKAWGCWRKDEGDGEGKERKGERNLGGGGEERGRWVRAKIEGGRRTGSGKDVEMRGEERPLRNSHRRKGKG